MKKFFMLFSILLICSCSYAQSNITMDLKDAPIRTTLEMVFKQAGIKNYVIDNNVAGFVTMTITDQPFENSLKLVMRAATEPLTYIKENDVYIVKVRQITQNNNPISLDISKEDKPTNNLSFEKNAIVITGFQAEGTLGRRLVDKVASVKIMGEYVDVRASIHTLGGLSAHADRDNLIKWLKGFKQKPKYVFIVHGEPSASIHFAQSIRETLNWNDVIIPTLQTTFDIN